MATCGDFLMAMDTLPAALTQYRNSSQGAVKAKRASGSHATFRRAEPGAAE